MPEKTSRKNGWVSAVSHLAHLPDFWCLSEDDSDRLFSWTRPIGAIYARQKALIG